MSRAGAPFPGRDPKGSSPKVHRLADGRWALEGATGSEHLIAPSEDWVAVER